MVTVSPETADKSTEAAAEHSAQSDDNTNAANYYGVLVTGMNCRDKARATRMWETWEQAQSGQNDTWYDVQMKLSSNCSPGGTSFSRRTSSRSACSFLDRIPAFTATAHAMELWMTTTRTQTRGGTSHRPHLSTVLTSQD